jgi:hypothetical protein
MDKLTLPGAETPQPSLQGAFREHGYVAVCKTTYGFIE